MYYRDFFFNRTSLTRPVFFFMVLEASVSGNLQTNPFHFQQLDLEMVRLNREGSFVRAPSLHKNDNLIRSKYTTMKDLRFEHGGYIKSLDTFENHLCLVFKRITNCHIENNSIHPIHSELTRAPLGIENNFSTATKNSIILFLLGQRRSVVLNGCYREIIKNSIICYG